VEAGLPLGRERHGRCLSKARGHGEGWLLGSLVYASMAKMEATDAGVAGMDAPGDTGAAGMEPRGRSKCQTVTDAVDRAGWDAGAGATSAFRR
jgi:hypothetical protein